MPLVWYLLDPCRQMPPSSAIFLNMPSSLARLHRYYFLNLLSIYFSHFIFFQCIHWQRMSLVFSTPLYQYINSTVVFVPADHYFITLAHNFWRFGPLGSQLNFSCQMLSITQTLKSQDYQQKSRIF